jgi:uncharacterized protein (DUF924 family)
LIVVMNTPASPTDLAVSSPDEVLRFWFGASPPTDEAALALKGQWFAKSDAFDAQIRARFGATIDAALAGQLQDWASTPQGWLALIVVLDQFTRNTLRGHARSFAGDAQAQTLAQQGLSQGWDRELCWLARPFVLLPLEHAEDLALQDECVTRFTLLCSDAQHRDAPKPVQDLLTSNLDYAQRHHEVIARFGRFPHRNAVLGRASSAEEQAYLAQPGAGF